MSRAPVGASRFARALLVVGAALVTSSTGLWLPAHAKPLTLADALSRARAAGFVLPAETARLRGSLAAVDQARVRPNPSVGLEVENFGGSGSYRGLASPETTLSYSQVIELGGKREARTTLALAEVDATRARGEVRLLDLFRDVELAWVDVMVAHAQLRLAEDRLAVALGLREEIARRSESGRDPLYAVPRVEAQVALEEIAVDQARSASRTARANLAGYWRGQADFEVEPGSFDRPASSSARGFNADLAVLEKEARAASARVALERTRATQDPSFRIGVRHLAGSSDAALVAGISVPLPLFDNNQANLARAQAERIAAENDVEASRRTLQREFARYRARLAASATEARRIEEEVIPQAQRAVQLVREGVQRGAFTFVDFSDAQRTLNDARLRRIEALRTFHTDSAALARLTGRHSRLLGRKARR